MEQTGKFSNGRAALGLLALVILAAAQLGAQLLASLPLMVGAPVWLGNVLAGVLYAALGVAGLLLLCGKGLRVTPEECRLAPVRLRPVWAASAVLMPALAAGALRAIQQEGLRVPEDIAVVGFDGTELADMISLTTIEQPSRDIGRKAVDLLLNKIDNPDAPTERVMMDWRFISRAST